MLATDVEGMKLLHLFLAKRLLFLCLSLQFHLPKHGLDFFFVLLVPGDAPLVEIEDRAGKPLMPALLPLHFLGLADGQALLALLER